jgi:3-keto-disaccharide hydrolase
MTTTPSRRDFLQAVAGVAAAPAVLRAQPGATPQRVAANDAQSAPNTIGPKERGWRLLFDGKTTAGWRGFRQQTLPAGWQVIDGALTRVGQAGDIVTVDEFGDFEVTLEWKLSPNGNSGLFYRVTEDDDVMWHTAPEYQIIDNAYKEPLEPVQYTGANYDLHPPSRDATKPIGSWNQTRVLVRGAHVEHWLNGVKVVEYELWTPDWERLVRASKFKDYPGYARARRGHIGLQDHGDRAAYRNIRLREIKN